MGRLILYRDQAYSEKEWEARQRQLAQQREYDARRRQNPERQAYLREWKVQNRERWNAYVREWMRRRRAA
jgi:hypothetical protein